MKEFKSKEERNKYFIYLIEVYKNNDCNKLEELLEKLDKLTLKYFIIYIIDNIKTLPKMNINIFVRLILDAI